MSASRSAPSFDTWRVACQALVRSEGDHPTTWKELSVRTGQGSPGGVARRWQIKVLRANPRARGARSGAGGSAANRLEDGEVVPVDGLVEIPIAEDALYLVALL